MKKLTIGIIFFITVSLLFALSPDRKLFDEAENRYINGELDFALTQYQRLLEKYPLSEYVSDANFRIAVITLRTGDLEKAEILFERVETRYKNTHFIDYLPFWKGLIKYKQKQWEQSSSLLAFFLDKKTPLLYKEASLYRAKAEFSLGKIRSAINILDTLFQSSIDIDNDPYLYTFYITMLEKDEQYKKIIELSKDLNKNQFTKSWMNRIYLIRGESFFKMGNIAEAEVLYQKILMAEPDIASIGYIRLFSIYNKDPFKQKDIFDKAQVSLAGHPELLNKFLLRVGIDSFKNNHLDLAASYLWRIWRTSDIKNINSLVPVYLSKMLISQGDKTMADKILSEYFSKVEPVDELILYTLSNVLIEEGKWTEAEMKLKFFLFTFPDSENYSVAAWMYAYSLYNTGQYLESKSVIDKILADGKGGVNTTDFIFLSAKVYLKLGKPILALAMFKEYLPFDINNNEIWFEIMKIQFNQGNYSSVLDSYNKMLSSSLLNSSSQYSLLIKYLAGLGDIAEGHYSNGLAKLTQLGKDIVKVKKLKTIEPYVFYYAAWASYKLSDYKSAFNGFKKVSQNYPESTVYADALYFAGWSVYLLGDYSSAADLFVDYSTAVSASDKVKGLFFYGKSLYAENKLNEAEIVFQNIYTQYPEDNYGDDAMFEQGKIYEDIGKKKLAVNTYQELYRRYKTSILAEESLFRVGEIYLSLGNYGNAVKSFYYHRLKFPEGKLIDVSLYWGSEAAEKNGEPYGAILLLEKLISEYSDSNFLPNALRKVASLYSEEGEYRKALVYYGEYLANYSNSESAAEVRTQIKKLNLLQSGSDNREAELLVLIAEQSTKSVYSREAYIELAKMYLYKYIGREKEAYNLLTTIADLKKDFPSIAARAVYYLGDYYSIMKDYTNAAKSFVEAATLDPKNQDLTGVSLLKAAEMAVAAGDIKTAEKMVNLLEINFPSSSWLQEGRTIMEMHK
ncbi:MAG: tetratricopeptide repeat protein [Spirochaetaceae bacterium]|nr:tetratricopeptide repeat protein [Spirochaetaceae bacterium]